MIPEKYKNTCPLDHSTYEKYIECDCNFGSANEVWYFKEQELQKTREQLIGVAEQLEKAEKVILRLSKTGDGSHRDKHASFYDCLPTLQFEFSERLESARQYFKDKQGE